MASCEAAAVFQVRHDGDSHPGVSRAAGRKRSTSLPLAVMEQILLD